MDKLSIPFKITCAVENTSCYERFEKGQRTRYVVGRASGTQVDHDHERVAESAIVAIQKAIENGILLDDGTWSQIPLMSEHEHGWDDVVGFLTKAWVDENWDLWIEAELDEDNPRASYLYTRLTKTNQYGRPMKQIGLSIGGFVLEAGYEFDEALNKNIRVFYDVGLNEVSVTSRPAYPTAFLTALNKSVAWDKIQQQTGRQVVVTEEIMKSFKHTETAPVEQVEKAADEVEQVEAQVEVEKSAEPEVEAEQVEKAAEVEVEAEQVEKAATDVRISIETWASTWDSDPMGALKDAVGSIISEVEQMRGVLKNLTETRTEAAVEKSADTTTDVESTEGVQKSEVEDAEVAEVEKSETVETGEVAVEKTADSAESAPVVAKSGTEVSEDVIAKALTDTLGGMLDEKLGPVASVLTDLEKRLGAIEAQEVDGSISVSKAIGNEPKEEPQSPEQLLEAELAGLTPAERIARLMRLQQGQ